MAAATALLSIKVAAVVAALMLLYQQQPWVAFTTDDSPAAQAQFNDMYKDFNKDNGTRFAGEAMKTMDMFAVDARSYTPESMENWLGKSEQYSYDKADEQTAQVFGDIWNKDYITEDWKMPTAPKAIESNAEEIADKAKEDIDDI